MLLVTGPTGSGKTTTLYSCLHHLNRPNRKIITVEDPVEYQLSGINQVPVRSEIGMSFASALRAMLRQAPNVIMVGEIRDLETAEIAINASLTGHMVFSTLHTNDAPGAVTRLIELGVKPFLVSTSLRGVLAQRLVRRICPACSRPHVPAASELRLMDINPALAGRADFRRGAGCPECQGTGYRGRMGIFELLTMDDALRELIHAGSTSVRLRQKARAQGLRTMREDGARKIIAGLTTVEEVASITVGDVH
jgi:general secretion pathway protein E/type IV pilus assembly protein PilB